MKKPFLILTFLLWSAPAFSAPTVAYFDNGSPDNTLPCTIGDPCDNFSGTTLDNNDALECGSILNFKRGETWTGSEAQVIIASSGCVGNPIIVQAYGTGADPILAGADVTTSGWSVHSGSIYSRGSQSQTHLLIVTEDDDKALFYWNGTNTTLPAGSFKREGSTLYVRLWDSGDPATNNVRIGSYAHTSSADGSRGLLSTADSVARGSNIWFRDIKIIAANGVGFSFSGEGNRSANIEVMGAGRDGWLCYHIIGFGGECSDYVSYYDEVSYSAAMGSGYGQGVTTYGGPFGWFVGMYSHHNAMAGIDFLDFNSLTNVTESGCLRCKATYNSLSPIQPSYDANLYSDGASELLIYGGEFHGGGGSLDNARASVTFGSEHPTTKPAENLYLINNLIYGTHWVAFSTDEECFGSVTECPSDGSSTPDNVSNLHIINNTFAADNSGGFEMVVGFSDVDQTAGNMRFRNNIVVTDSAYANAYVGDWPFFDADNNLYYKRGASSSSTEIYASGGGGAPRYSLSAWATLQGEEASSVYGDPLLTTDTTSGGVDTIDPTLGALSPAINAGMESPYTVPAWLPATIATDIGSCGVKGSVLATGVLDSCANIDIGYHKDYAGLVSGSVALSTYTVSNAGTMTISFTIPDKVTAFLYQWKFKAILPSGFALNYGATTAATSSDISGTWNACSVSGQEITCTRASDGQSEFPGTYSVVLSNVRNPESAGTTGTFDIEIQDASGTKISEQDGIAGVSISSGAPPVCGNSVVEAGETCDDGGTTPGDGCDASCQVESPECGNGIIEEGEQCDDDNLVNLDGCDDTCQIENPVCGNGVVEDGETCDDNNTDNGDGCSASCATESSGTIEIGKGSCASMSIS